MSDRNKHNRQDLRKSSTDPERLVWSLVRNRRLDGWKFRRQESIGPYIVDFVCYENRLIIEIDGDYHDHVVEKDLERQKYFESQGFHVIRFSNEDVTTDIEAIRIAIQREIATFEKNND